MQMNVQQPLKTMKHAILFVEMANRFQARYHSVKDMLQKQVPRHTYLTLKRENKKQINENKA